MFLYKAFQSVGEHSYVEENKIFNHISVLKFSTIKINK